MFCPNCGIQLADGTKFCPQCGKPTDTPLVPQSASHPGRRQETLPPTPPLYQQPLPFQQQININVQQQPIAPKTKWETPRLVIGIITIVLFFLLQFQSCVAYVGESLQSIVSDTAGTSGMTGYIVSFFFLIAGIVSIACRKSKGGAIAAGVLYAMCGFATISEDFSYFTDLAFYCVLSFVFGAVMIIGGVAQKEMKGE